MAILEAGRPCVACPFCNRGQAIHPDSTVVRCYKCAQEFDSRGSKVDGDGKPHPPLSVKVFGAEFVLPPIVVDFLLIVACILLAALVGLVGLRIASPATYTSVVGAAQDVRTMLSIGTETVRFSSSFTLFVPDDTEGAAAKWLQFRAKVAETGLAGFTRWKVEGFDGKRDRSGWFVFVAVPNGASADHQRLKEAFQEIYGSEESYFVMTSSNR